MCDGGQGRLGLPASDGRQGPRITRAVTAQQGQCTALLGGQLQAPARQKVDPADAAHGTDDRWRTGGLFERPE